MPATLSREEVTTPCSELPGSADDGRSGNSYAQILKSSALVGGSQALNVAIGVLRTKVMAILLGPSGFGLFGIYWSISELAQTIAGLGINSSGVRQIAEAVGSSHSDHVAATALTLRRTSLVLGLIGAMLVALFSRQIAVLTFGSDQHAAAIAVLSLAVFFRQVYGGQTALIQGMRRVSDLAKINFFGALTGTIVGLPMVYLLRDRGIVASLLAIAGAAAFTSWLYSRKVLVDMPAMRLSLVVRHALPLLKFGLAFMLSGLLTMGSGYVVRVLVLHQLGFQATGIYQAAWTLGCLYVSFILQAMGADFYPRLTASANDHAACNRMVNEQAQVGLLIAGPGALATVTCAPLVIFLFYTAQFHPAVTVLRWICLGTTLRVITFPMGFVSLAKGKSKIFFLSDLAWTCIYLGLSWLLVGKLGVTGAGLAFFMAYVIHGCYTYPIARRLTGFRWSKENARIATIFSCLIGFVFWISYMLPLIWATAAGLLVVVGSMAYAAHALLHLLPRGVPTVLRAVVARLNRSRWVSPAA